VAAAFVALASAGPCQAQPAAASPADASDADACFNAAERAQPLLRQKRFREAKAVLEVCAREVCPRAAKTDCRQWLSEAIDAQPSILIVAHESRGRDVHDVHGVRATVDATYVVEDADTTPLMLDPGRHRIKLERPDVPPIEQSVDVHEGDKNHVVDFYWRAAVEPLATRPVPTSVYATLAIAGGTGVVGAIFEGAGLAKRGALDSCKPNCSTSDVFTARSLTAVGDISLGVAALFAIGGTILYLVRPTVEAPPPDAVTAWTLAPVPGGFVGGFRLRL
jgi:hypothetical protein